MLTLREIAAACGGSVTGASALVPGPGHGPKDRSLSVTLAPGSPMEFLCHSHAGDGWQACRDHVADRLGLAPFDPKGRREVSRPRVAQVPKPAPIDDGRRTALALDIWRAGRDPRRTIVEVYLASRGLALDADLAGKVLRFSPECPWKDESGSLLFIPCMIALLRDIRTDEPRAIQRTRLDGEGRKVGRMSLGPVAGAVIKVDSDEMVEQGLVLAEGLETGMTGRQLGLRPVWVTAGTAGIASFPVLPGIDGLTLIAEHGEGSCKAVEACTARWIDAGVELVVNLPTDAASSDLNDALQRSREAS